MNKEEQKGIIDKIKAYLRQSDDRESPCQDEECEGEYIYLSTTPGYNESTTHYECSVCGHHQSFP